MTKIDGNWIKQRLDPDKRGEKAALARATGLKAKQVSEILSGLRSVSQEEASAIAAFFGETLQIGETPAAPLAGMSEGARAYQPDGGSAAESLLVVARRNGAKPMLFRVTKDRPDLSICAGDVALVDSNDPGSVGDTVICGLSDPATGAAVTDIRRRLDPWLAGAGAPVRMDTNAQDTAIYGTVIAVLRLSGLA